MSTQIYIMTHKPFSPPNDPLYIPLQVGRAGASGLGFLTDDTGDNISAQNPYFCELTGMYWLWKNVSNVKNIGVCHYRRYLINENGSLFTVSELDERLRHYDIITTKMLDLTCSYYHGFSENHHRKDLIATEEVIKEKYPMYADAFHTLVHGTHTYFGNIFITSKARYDSYCTWLFDILFEVQKRTDFSGYNDYNKRLFGFLSEFLQTVWICYHKLRVLECKVGMSGEKYETKKLREQLASYLERREYEKAKACFLNYYSKRPDVLMEASDVTGELRLCMQIISTCSFEDEMYQTCILDAICDYKSLIAHFHRLNTAIHHFLADAPTEQDLQFFKQNECITRMSIDISLRLFCKKAELRQQISDRIWDVCQNRS